MTEIIQSDPEIFRLEESQNRQMIIAIKKARVEKRLSYQAIVDGCEKNGDYVSMSTVRRVCAEGSENHRFRYEATLRPIARFVLGLDEDVPAAEAATEDGPAANELLRVVVGIKEDTITEMRQDIEEHEAELAEKDKVIAVKDHMIAGLESGIKDREQQIAKIREEAASRIDEKDSRINYLIEEIKEKNAENIQLKKTIKAQTVAIIVIVLVLIGYLTYIH